MTNSVDLGASAIQLSWVNMVNRALRRLFQEEPKDSILTRPFFSHLWHFSSSSSSLDWESNN